MKKYDLSHELVFDTDEKNLYTLIKDYSHRGKIYIWGVGGFCPGVVYELKKHNINYAGYFVDMKEYHKDSRIGDDKPIYYFHDLIQKEEKFSVIMGHSRYELINNLKQYKNIENVWALPMIVRNDISMDKQYVQSNIDNFQYTLDKLSDDISKKNMINYLNSQITQDETPIIKNFLCQYNFFNADVIKLNSTESYLDVGAYDGNSIETFINTVHDYQRILAIEVMKEEYKNLKEKFKNLKNIEIMNIGISDHNGVDKFVFSDQSTVLSNDKENGEEVEVLKLDDICKMYDFTPSLIKICTGGTSIVPILNGGKETLRTLPKMVLSAGIDKRALIDYIKLIEDIVGEEKYNYYLRYMNANSARLMLYAIPK